MTYIPSWREEAKRRAAREAVNLVKDGYTVGLGSGSTVAHAIVELGRKIRDEKILVLGVPTSYQALTAALREGIPITTLEEHPVLEISIDGADEIDEDLNLIKGGGAALTREKIVCFAARKRVIVADETKLVKKLGSSSPVPVEVLPFALSVVVGELRRCWDDVRVREGGGKVGPVVTDNGNFVVDVYCGEVENPRQMDRSLKEIPGIVESGLFVDMVDIAYVGSKRDDVRKLFRPRK